MKKMQTKKELIELIREHGGQITPEKLLDLISATDTIIASLSDDEQSVELHLDSEIIATINRALLTPLSLTEFKLVGVNPITTKKGTKKVNASEQMNVGLDSATLEIKDGKLGVKLHLYQHRIYLLGESGNSEGVMITILNTSDSSFNMQTLKQYIRNNGINNGDYYYYECFNNATLPSADRIATALFYISSSDKLMISNVYHYLDAFEITRIFKQKTVKIF